MIAILGKGILRGCPVYMDDRHVEGYSDRIPAVVLVSMYTLIPNVHRPGHRGGWVSQGQVYHISRKRLGTNCIPDTLKFHEGELSKLKLFVKGRPDKVAQKKILECIPV